MTIVVPRGAEARAVRKGNPQARIVEVAAGAQAGTLLPEIAAGELVVVLGLCGALRDRRVGDVVVYRRVADGTAAIDLDAALREELAPVLGATIVDAWTADHVVTTVTERTALASRSQADVVDMEGTHLARALAARGVRIAMVRVVSDDASRDLPALERAVRANGTVDAARIAWAFVRTPRAAFAFARDVRSALSRLGETAAAVLI